MIKSKFVKVVEVIDPDSSAIVEIEIRKLETGAMVGIDGSYLEQDVGDVCSPYDKYQLIEIKDQQARVCLRGLLFDLECFACSISM